MNAVPWLAAADGWRPSCDDGKSEPNDWFGGTFLVEAVPILLDKVFETFLGTRRSGIADAEVHGEFGGVPFFVPEVDVNAV